jgi:OmpA-OmpF porin, OOP family
MFVVLAKQEVVTSIRDRRRPSAMLTSVAALLFSGASASIAFAQAQSAAPIVQPTTGFYIGGAAGGNFMESNRFRGGGATGEDTYNGGWVGSLAFGYGLGNGIRLELEPGYRNNAVDRINGKKGDSRIQIATGMANVLYDFTQFQTPWVPLTPHVGLGVGYAHVWDRSAAPGSGTVAVSGDTGRLAAQAIGGLDYALAPGKKIGLEYRYMLVHDAHFRVDNGLTTRAGDLNNHSVLATFRYEFNTPPEAPPPVAPATTMAPQPPAAAQPVPRNYQVYFEFDRSTLTPDARQVVQQAAQNALQGNASHIIATGHTDTVGTTSYNLALSRRRAEAVRAELVRDGVPRNEITTNGVGENDLAVPTAQGVNEPRNRRVEITIQQPGT